MRRFDWGGLSVLIGLIVLAVATMPFGIVILLGVAYVYAKS